MEIREIFKGHFGKTPALLVRAPGRVNLLGEHVDYNDGPVLPAAIDRAVFLAATSTSNEIITLYAKDFDDQVSFSLQSLEAKCDIHNKPLPKWAYYPAGVAWSLKKAGLEVSGLQAAYSSDIPIGSGLSSSAAVEVAFAVAWSACGGWDGDKMKMARLCQQAENGYVGVASGLMDQFASLHGVEDHTLYFDTRSLVWEALPLPPSTALVIADTGIRRNLADSGYNERRRSCERAVKILQTHLPEIGSLRDVSPVELAALSEFLPVPVRQRAEHVVKEIARVETAVIALRRSDKRTFGALMFAGHASLRDLYEVSCPELDILVEIAHPLPGCLGARMTGAGFGGCTVNLVEETETQNFIKSLRTAYQEEVGHTPQIYLCKASEGARLEILNFN